jgi:hypothetical protein
MNRLSPYGSLKNAKIFIFACTICLSMGYSAKGKKNIHVSFRNILGDTVQMEFKNKLIITIINEPACTGCKVNLLKYMETHSRIRQLYMLDWQYDIVNRKNYRNYIHELNRNAIDAYPLSDKDAFFMLNDSMVHISKENSPYQLWISMNKNIMTIKKIPYKDIFESIHIKDEYFDLLHHF